MFSASELDRRQWMQPCVHQFGVRRAFCSIDRIEKERRFLHILYNRRRPEYSNRMKREQRKVDDEIFILALQPPLLDSFSVINDQIHLTVRPPLGSYDYFTVRCLDGFALNSTSRQPIMVNCSVLPNVALTNILLETGKNGYPTVISSIDREGETSEIWFCSFWVNPV